MNAPDGLWRQWAGQLRACLPELHGHRSKTLAFFVLGVVLAGSTRLPRVAETLGGLSAAKTPSIERRLARFLANDHMAVVPVWTRLLGQFLSFWRDRRLVFVLDATALDARATVLYLGLLVHSRLLPVSWQVLPVHEPWEQRQWDVVGALLDRVIPHLGTADCTLLADRGLVGHALVQLCQQRGWHYILRVSVQHTCQPTRGRGTRGWIPCRQLVPQRGRCWYGPVRLWQEQPLSAQLSATWEPNRPEPWIVLSDRPAGRRRVREYALRMRVESTFQDLKRRGWDLEGTVIADRARLDRLLLVVFLSLWWLAHLAASCLHHGQRARFDRHDRRDKGLFRLGRLWLLDILRRAVRTTTLTWCLPFRKTPMGWAFSLRF
jgi:Transposase DDE domain